MKKYFIVLICFHFIFLICNWSIYISPLTVHASLSICAPLSVCAPYICTYPLPQIIPSSSPLVFLCPPPPTYARPPFNHACPFLVVHNQLSAVRAPCQLFAPSPHPNMPPTFAFIFGNASVEIHLTFAYAMSTYNYNYG
jgi:hypothetical protein